MRLGLAGIAIASVLLVAGGATSPAGPRPLLGGYAYEGPGPQPPSEAQCEAGGRRCFTPAAIRSAYHVGPLYAAQADGRGQTIAVVNVDGSPTIAHDLHVFDQAFGLQPMCGEEGVTCDAGMPALDVLDLAGSHAVNESWALETTLDVEAAHAIAPRADILLVQAPETATQQGFTGLMSAEKYVLDHRQATVISQSFGAPERSLDAQALQQLRQVFSSAQAAGVSVLAASGDSGARTGVMWPASDPLVTGVGGTALCTDPAAAATAPRVYAPGVPVPECAGGQPETAWSGSGGGYSAVFGVPPWQTGSTRGVPDVAAQASPATGALIYKSSASPGQSRDNGRMRRSETPSGWFNAGGTSLAAPEWAGLVAIAAQLHGGSLGLLNPALYGLPADDFFDVTSGSNNGYFARPGWDAITGRGTPDAAKLVPDLAAG